MSAKYFYAYASKEKWEEPVTLEELKALAARETLNKSDQIWTEGMLAWTPAEAVPEIFASFPTDFQTAGPIIPPVPVPFLADTARSAVTMVVGQCGKCQTINPGDNRFCSECGSLLYEVCPACKVENRRGHEVLRQMRRGRGQAQSHCLFTATGD